MMMRPLNKLSAPAGTLWLLCLLALSGCSGAKTASNGAGGATASDTTRGGAESPTIAAAASLLEKLRADYASTPMLSLTGDMKIAGAGITVWYDALARGRDSLKINLVGPFGVPVGALSATPNAFLFFNAQEGAAVEGRPDRETFGKLMQLDLEYDEMASMLRGELPRFPASGSYTASEEDGVMHYTVTTARSVERFDLDIDQVAVRSYTRSIPTASGPVEEFAITYKDFYPLGERQFPKKVYVNIANGEQKVTVSVDKMRSTIDKDRSCALVLPPGVERRRL